MSNRKVTDHVPMEHCYINIDDEYSYNGTAHEVPAPENHPIEQNDPSRVPNCVLKMKKRPKESAASIKELLRRRLRRRKIFMISVDVEENNVAICGYVNPATIIWQVTDCAGVEATLVFFKEHPRQGELHPLCCQNFVFKTRGKYCNLVKEELQKTKDLKSVIVDNNTHSRVWMSISGDCFDTNIVHKRIMKLCDRHYQRDRKTLSKKSTKRTTRNLKASNGTTNTFEKGRGTLVLIDDSVVSNSLTNVDSVQITMDFIVPRNYGRECATEINEMLLSTKGVNFVLTHFRGTRLASVNVRGDDRLDLDTIVETISNAGGIKPRLRKSMISFQQIAQLIIYTFSG